jgi:amino acid transporter
MPKVSDSTDTEERALGFWSTVAIGVGGMVGGGIFAVLGLAVALARGGTPIAFAVAGLVALVTAYSYARLSVHFQSQGGTVVFIDRAFGRGLLTGSLNALLWTSYIVMLALYAFAFGSYGATFIPDGGPLVRHALITAGILVPTVLNMLATGIVGRAETWIVGIKIAILTVFVAVGAFQVDPSRLAPGTWAGAVPLIAGGMIIFLAYEGFELMANAAEDVREPERTLPRAFYTTVLFVIVLYVLVSLVTVGSMPLSDIVAAKDYALAEAARPSLGAVGFTVIGVAAMLSTFSAINATLYGAARLSYTIAKEGELPEVLEKKVWNRPIEGLLVTAVLSTVLANLGDLSSISMMGSAGFLLVFAVVNAAAAKLSAEIGARKSVAVVGACTCVVALGALVWQTVETHPTHLLVLAGMLLSSFSVELVYRELRGRKLSL